MRLAITASLLLVASALAKASSLPNCEGTDVDSATSVPDTFTKVGMGHFVSKESVDGKPSMDVMLHLDDDKGLVVTSAFEQMFPMKIQINSLLFGTKKVVHKIKTPKTGSCHVKDFFATKGNKIYEVRRLAEVIVDTEKRGQEEED